LVTVTVTPLAMFAGVRAVRVVALTTVTLRRRKPPMVTVAPAKKPVPVMVTSWLPMNGPVVGEIALTVGAGP